MAMLSGLLVPIIMRDRAIGAMLLQDCQTPRHWSIDDTAFFGSLADNLAVAIENADLHEEKKLQAVTDGLTGVSNRRHFNDMFQKEFERAKRYAEPLSLIIVDLDYLKKINDTYGHQAGDEAIRSIGKVMSQSCRSVDLPARYGGEEFCLLLPNTDLEMAAVIAERLRKLINETQIEGPGNISASIGLANYPLHANETDSLFMRADEALYKAKQSGRNRVCISDGEPSAH
jgi:diguanylate cyclase (GGDEF)-like protein